MWFVRDTESAHLGTIDRIRSLADKSAAMHIPFYVASSSDREICQAIQKNHNMRDIPFLIIDGTVSKTALRSNPGLMLLKDGIVVKKWSFRDYPADISLENGVLKLK